MSKLILEAGRLWAALERGLIEQWCVAGGVLPRAQADGLVRLNVFGPKDFSGSEIGVYGGF
jgi:hypothetical protein